jgi:dihydrofolate reductase
MITLIAAINHNNLLGKDNDMPWHVPEDLNHFKAETLHKVVLMGRKTYQSLPGVLKNRKIYVLTASDTLDNIQEDVTIIHDLEAFITKFIGVPKELMVAGGASIYKQVLPYADKIVLSLIDDYQHGDVYFPTFTEEEFKLENTIINDTFTVKEYKRIR